jgi:hypothetical protein
VEHARDFQIVISDAVKDGIGMRKYRSQSRQQFVPQAPSERVPPRPAGRTTYFPQNAVGNLGRRNARVMSPDYSQIFSGGRRPSDSPSRNNSPSCVKGLAGAV